MIGGYPILDFDRGTELWLRGATAIELFIGIIMFGVIIGTEWKVAHRSRRVLMVGGAMILVAILAAQAKAVLAGISFDLFSLGVMAGVTMFDVGLVLSVREASRGDK